MKKHITRTVSLLCALALAVLFVLPSMASIGLQFCQFVNSDMLGILSYTGTQLFPVIFGGAATVGMALLLFLAFPPNTAKHKPCDEDAFLAALRRMTIKQQEQALEELRQNDEASWRRVKVKLTSSITPGWLAEAVEEFEGDRREAQRFLNIVDEVQRREELHKLKLDNEPTYIRVKRQMEALRSAARSAKSAGGAAVLDRMGAGTPAGATASEAQWLVLPDQNEMLLKLSELMGTQDRNQILRAALHLLYNAYRPGCVPISPTSYEAPEQVQWAMNAATALSDMPEYKLAARDLRETVRFWKLCCLAQQGDECARDPQDSPGV